MMEEQISLREANQHLSRYVKAVEQGVKFLITNRGVPVARLIPVEKERTLNAEQQIAFKRTVTRMKRGYSLEGQFPSRENCLSAERISLNTNILFYAVDRDSGKRHGQA
jgi:prevent-host-death family protein